MPDSVKVLIVEDLPTDAELCQREVKKALASCIFRRVETRRDYLEAIEKFQPDIILSDYKLPAFDGMTALQLALKNAPQIPFVVVTGSMNEDTAVECMKAGAWDYVIKEHIKRLGPVVVAMLEEKKLREAKRQADDALKNSEERHRRISSIMTDMTFSCIASRDGGYVLDWMSGAVEAITGYTVGEIIQRSCWRFLVIDEDLGLFEKEVTGLSAGQNSYCELRIISKGGTVVWVAVHTECVAVPDAEGSLRIYGGIKDITEHRTAEASILRSKMLLQNVIDTTPDWMYVKDREHRYLMVNKSFATAQGLSPQEMVGRPDTDFFSNTLCYGDPQKGITGYHEDDDNAFAGRVVHNPKNMITWADGTHHVYDTFKIPLSDHEGRIYGALVYSRDITERQAAEDDRADAFSKLQKTLDDFIDSMAKIIELRDPYTAGHQSRVAELSVAIARAMGLTDEQVKYIRVAALIHDIGKIYVPSDILSKPGRLTDMEWQLIRTHPQGSYDILKMIEFPWPVALVALQHHERNNGSGYPQGIKGSEIMLEARIIAVADVVEAMASHRPYRQSLGIDAALQEITKNRGVLYDEAVVDACLKLFGTGEFRLPV